MCVRVAVVRCEDYDKSSLALDRGMELLGGWERFVTPGQPIVLKPNLMRKSAPETCTVVHPQVVAALALGADRRGAKVLVAESPGGVYNPITMKGIFASSGVEKALAGSGCSLYTECESVAVSWPDAKRLKQTQVIRPIFEAQTVWNIPKLKTHTLTAYSGAIKNLFGVIPGMLKAEYHFQHQTEEQFTDMLLDIAQHIRPRLSVIDAICAMEGDGPGLSGTPRQTGLMILSEDVFAADWIGAQIIGFDPMEIPMLRQAKARGLVPEEIEVVGETVEAVRIPDFKRAVSAAEDGVLQGRVPRFMIRPVTRILTTYPRIRKNACVGCGMCENICPRKAISMQNKKAAIRKKSCIRCFCCMEFCPAKAVEARRSRLFKTVSGILEK